MPIYSCHTLATEAAGKKILTIEGVGDEKNLHPLQRIGHTHVAADCGFCTAGWVVTAKALLDKNPNPSADQVKAALAGHICRCAAYPAIIRTVMDSAAVLRGEKIKIEAEPESIVQIKLPMVRDYSTSGGHLPGDEVLEGAQKTVTKKWQGYPPENLNVLGKPMPRAARGFHSAVHRQSAVREPSLVSGSAVREVPHLPASARPHQESSTPPPRRRCPASRTSSRTRMRRSLDTVRGVPAGFRRAMPGGAAAGTQSSGRSGGHRCRGDGRSGRGRGRRDPGGVRSPAVRIHSQGRHGPRCARPARRKRKSSAAREFAARISQRHVGGPSKATSKRDSPKRTSIKEFTYHFAGGVSVPMQPSGSVAKWDGDKLTFWGMGQGIYPVRAVLAAALGIDPSKIRFINKWNGSTFGSARLAAERFYPLIAHLAKVTGRPVKVMLPKDQELAQLQIKPETITKFKVGVKKDGRITAIDHEVYVSVGELEFGGHADGPGNAFNQLELYTSQVPHWRSLWCAYRTNAPRPGPSRSHYQQETKWSWENMMDEMAEAVGIDPVEFRLMHITAAEAGRHALSLRFVSLRGGAGRRRQGIRMGQAKSSGGRRAGKIQARIRPRHVAASWRPDGLSRRRRSFREIGGGAEARRSSAPNWSWRPTAT